MVNKYIELACNGESINMNEHFHSRLFFALALIRFNESLKQKNQNHYFEYYYILWKVLVAPASSMTVDSSQPFA